MVVLLLRVNLLNKHYILSYLDTVTKTKYSFRREILEALELLGGSDNSCYSGGLVFLGKYSCYC